MNYTVRFSIPQRLFDKGSVVSLCPSVVGKVMSVFGNSHADGRLVTVALKSGRIVTVPENTLWFANL